MTLKSQQKKARHLAAKGCTPVEIADVLGVSHRSVQRWLAKDKGATDQTPTPAVAHKPVTTSAIEKESRESQHQRAIEMYESGLEPSAIAEALGIPFSTVLRWLQSASSTEESQKLISSLSEEQQAIFVRESPDSSLWVEAVERALHEHQEGHRDIRRKLHEILQTLLSASDLNCRAIHTISQAYNRHTDAERKALSIELLDLNRAIALLQAHKLGVVDFSQMETLKRQQLKN